MSKQSPTSDALLAKVKSRLKGLQDNTKRATGTWKPQPGEQTIRLVPYKFTDFPFIELYFHYDLAKENLLSPVSSGNPDPVVEYAEKINSEGTRESWLLSRKLMPTMRTYVPVIVRGEEDKGVKFWGIGKRTYEEILQIMDDSDYGNIFDPHTGTDLKVTFITADEAGNKYGKINVNAKRNASPLGDSDAQIEKFLNDQKPITDIYKEKTYDELMEALKEWLKTDAEKADTETTDIKEAPTVTEEDKNVVKKAGEKFDEFFNKDKSE